ncbi:hypothetical protein HK405_007493 [Cladochytrium tenue]|nr:hypothetical protein HK405_007493 [Cladochytrium tenue]
MRSIVLAYALNVSHDVALKDWSISSVRLSTSAETSSSWRLIPRFDSYVVIAFLALLSLQLRYVAQVAFSLQASRNLHETATRGLLHAPAGFFDVTPSGRVANRFGKDLRAVDVEVSASIGETVQQLVHGLVVVFMISSASPALLLLAIPIEVVGSLVAFAAGAAVALSKRPGSMSLLDAGWSGLCLSYSGMLTDVLTWLVRNSATLEMAMTSVERVKEYADMPQETLFSLPSDRPPLSWPTAGELEIGALRIRYGPESSYAVQLERSLTIPAGQRVGVVGRTGSGKSTLCASLSRLVNIEAGDVAIDGVRCSRLGVHELRRAVTVVPQDAFLFDGSLRSNLDPLGLYDDHTLRKALESLGASFDSRRDVADAKQDAGLALDFHVASEGGNLSAGKRQLVSLARAVVRRLAVREIGGTGGVLVLDEATSSIDATGDAAVQRALRAEFSGCDADRWTVVVVAHRLRTVLDADRVLVMEEGRVVEDGEPGALLATGSGRFWELCSEAGVLDEGGRAGTSGR